MYETVKVVNGYEITRMKGTRGAYHVNVREGEGWREFHTFRSIKAAAEFIERTLQQKPEEEPKISVELTDSEIELLMYAVEGYSARAKMQAAQGMRDREKTKRLTDKLCAVNAKLYQIILAQHNTADE